MKIKNFFYLLIIFYLSTVQTSSLENKIILKVNNKIITTFDIKQEEKYLIILNKNLKKIDPYQLKDLAIDSIVKEKIKELELVKYYQIEKALDDKNLNMIIKDLYQTLGFQKEKEFKKYLESQNLIFSSVKRKLAIEMLWNNLIFQKYNNRVVIDKIEIKNNLDEEIKKLNFSEEIFLSEILLRNSKDLNLDMIYLEILKSIKNFGFAATANIYSASDTAKIGGKVGWVKETSLSKQIQKNLINLEKSQVSKPIKINENYLILRIDDKRVNKKKINKDRILSNKIMYEQNRQLESFSLAHFNKVKQNILINEL
jgi:peptidyl-prolyl cis-trans isomerase SurA